MKHWPKWIRRETQRKMNGGRERARKGRMEKEKQKLVCSDLGPMAMFQAVLAAPLMALSERPRYN